MSRITRTSLSVTPSFRNGALRALSRAVTRYPIVHQHDATDCGPAVLAMVALHYRKRVSIAKLRELAGTDRQGTNLTGLVAAADQVGFHARGVRATRDALAQIPLPAIAHWR